MCWLGLAWPKPWPEVGKKWFCTNRLYTDPQCDYNIAISFPDPYQCLTADYPHPPLETNGPSLLRHHPPQAAPRGHLRLHIHQCCPRQGMMALSHETKGHGRWHI
jgi:hypothetical protein